MKGFGFKIQSIGMSCIYPVNLNEDVKRTIYLVRKSDFVFSVPYLCLCVCGFSIYVMNYD